MTYHKKLRAVFLHIPRTGGSSIKVFLRGNGFIEEATHADHVYIKSKLGSDWNNYFKFSIVRNPFSRMVSWYNFLILMVEKVGKDRRGRVILHPGTFENFILNHKRIYKGQDIGGYSFRKQQVEFIGDDLDFVGRYENLQNDFNFICKRLKIKEAELITKKQSKKVDYRNYYDSALKEMMYKIFKQDFKKFGYEF